MAIRHSFADMSQSLQVSFSFIIALQSSLYTVPSQIHIHQ